MNNETDIAIPIDDGKCDHLLNMQLPKLTLKTTSNNTIDLSKLEGLTVVYFYPRMGRPDVENPVGWSEIAGASGCTPQSCSFKEHQAEFDRLKVSVYGVSTQSSTYQKEAVDRLALPFEILSDEHLDLTEALNLPTFEVEGVILTKRVTLICHDAEIIKVFYPVFPPKENAQEVLSCIEEILV